MKTDIQIEDCKTCYETYKRSKSFNHDCPIYVENLGLSKDYKQVCVWIKIMESEQKTLENRI